MPKSLFNEILLEAVDAGLSSLGESSKQAIYFHLEKTFNIRKSDIPYNIKAFKESIQKIFGLGANFLEILIMKALYEKIGGVFEWRESTDLAFVEYVAVARRAFQEKENSGMTEELAVWEKAQVES